MRVSATCLCLVLVGCQPSTTERPLSVDLGKRLEATEGMVSTAHPLASDAGLEMLIKGGNAVDAAVAAAFAIGVVEPMMAGLGGGGGMLIWSQVQGRADYLDFYATAPANPDEGFLLHTGPWNTPLGVAVPGTVPGLLEAHDRFGLLPRDEVLSPAIRLAEDGFPVGGLLARLIADDSTKLNWNADARRIFWPGGRPLGAGETLLQPELATTLRLIAREGRAGFDQGPAAREIVSVLNAGGNPMTEEDLQAFTPRWKRPVCGEYRGRVVMSAPPPQSGMQIVQTLNLLESHDLTRLGYPVLSPEAFHLLASALRVSTADREAYLGDPDHAAVPVSEITSRSYAATRGHAVTNLPIPDTLVPGSPWAEEASSPSPSCVPLEPFQSSGVGAEMQGANGHQGTEGPAVGETTHISVVDGEGNGVSLTFTQGVYFGTGTWAAGTFLNSAMFLFSGDRQSPNALAPHRAPLSTTTPTILLEDGKLKMVLGSPAGGRIPPAVVQTIVYLLDFGLDPLDAVRMPRLNSFPAGTRVEVEQGITGEVLGQIRGMGYEPEVRPPLTLHFGGVNVIERRGDRWVGAADPRREGEVRGLGLPPGSP
jgi:gamma-glutamyltranspeptidase / glutathione hydrolase